MKYEQFTPSKHNFRRLLDLGTDLIEFASAGEYARKQAALPSTGKVAIDPK